MANRAGLLLVLLTLISMNQAFILDWFLTKDHNTVKAEKEVTMTAVELITSKGMPADTHEVQTVDGYVLSVHRIPRPGATPVFLQHGLLDSSATWLANLRHQSLAFILYDAGYDVWLGNVRGNTYSKKHVNLSVDSRDFWDFSFDEFQKYDLPAMLEHIVNTTAKPYLYYVGHSQGTLIAFAQLSSNQELAAKVKMFFALGPVTTLRYITSPIARLLSGLENVIPTLFGMKEFFPAHPVVSGLSKTLCRSLVRTVCSNIVFVISGESTERQLNMTRLPVYIGHTPAGTSTKNMLHFAQLIQSGQFQAYNYKDLATNIAHYGQSSPPLYRPENLQTPVMLYTGSEDTLADPRDVEMLLPKLKNLRGHITYDGWSHLDFVWGATSYKTIYKDIVEKINAEEANIS